MYGLMYGVSDDDGPDVLELGEELAREALSKTFDVDGGCDDPVRAALWVAFDWTPDPTWPTHLTLAVRPVALWECLSDRDPAVEAHNAQAFRHALTARMAGLRFPNAAAVQLRHAVHTPDLLLRTAA